MKTFLLFFFSFFSMQLFSGQTQEAANSAAYFCSPCNSSCDKRMFEQEGSCPHCGMKLVKQNPEERASSLRQDKIRVGFYLQDGIEVLDFAGPMEVFAYAGFEVFTISKTKNPIISQGVLTIIPEYSIEDAPEADILAFFGGNSSRAFEDEALVSWVKSREAKTDFFFSVCTGAFLLGRAGILDGLTVTTFHSSIESLRQLVPEATVLEDVRYVDNGRVVTTAGISAGIDGALHLVSRLKGKDVARKTAEYMEYDKWVPEEGLILTKE